jgi:hypothetical protein
MITKEQRDHKASTKTKPKPYHSQPNHTPYSREDPRPLVSTSLAIMIVVHLAKVSAMYPWVVISSLPERLEKPPFCHSSTSFGVWPIDNYMSLQRSTTGVYHPLLRFPEQTFPACSAKVSHTGAPSYTMWFRHITKYVANPHSTE